MRHDRSILRYTKVGDILLCKNQEKPSRIKEALNDKPGNSLSGCHGNNTLHESWGLIEIIQP